MELPRLDHVRIGQLGILFQEGSEREEPGVEGNPQGRSGGDNFETLRERPGLTPEIQVPEHDGRGMPESGQAPP